jgi:hypothetical protein
MKTFKQYTVLPLLKVLGILLLAIVITSCGKDGEIGPKGETGTQGAAGAQGIPGKEGSVILSGTGAPSSVGNNGDMYLDKSTSNLYGPKTAAGWGTPLSLKGESGAVGGNGSTILNGTTVPTTVGINGDYYLNKTNADLYGPKTAAGWGTPINLKGSANVVGSTWMSLKAWNASGVNYIREVKYDIPNPILNAVGYSSLGAMLEKGGVLLVYFDRGGYNYPIPANLTPIGYSYIVKWYILRDASTNAFYLSVVGVNNAELPNDLLTLPFNHIYSLRYVLIPAGSQFASMATLKNMNYEQVKDLLKLKD